ncbi:hypothetical protein [Paenibacillus daejeonensis]|uniref:hypothetical protein n=1 Tax=Paenibacillus daejeonensis TaxID=135193 RepID=UPI0003709EB7|nr:hypothetical protein [Paenibacillus daejeonensis]
MNTVRVYEKPEQFAEMMQGQLREATGMRVQPKGDNPLLLEVWPDTNRPEEKVEISLHETYGIYQNTGDLNMAVDYLNGMVRSTLYVQQHEEKLMTISARYLYPAVRDERYVVDNEDMGFVSEPFLPGLRMVFLDIKDDVVKVVNQNMLERNPRFTEEKVKRIAKNNLRAEGWQEPKLELPSPTRKSCIIDVYQDYPYPVEAQFFTPELSGKHMPESYAIAFTNRRIVLTLRSSEPMDTPERVRELVHRSKFKEVVQRSCRVMPGPVSEQIYWVHKGSPLLL